MTEPIKAERATPVHYGTLGQWLWLVGGGWTGFWVYELIRANIAALPRFDIDYLLLPAMIGSPVVFALCTGAFPIWHAVRTQMVRRSTPLAWWAPFLLGLPLIGAMWWLRLVLYDLIDLDRPWPNALFALLAPLGLPVPAAEACVWISGRRGTSPR